MMAIARKRAVKPVAGDQSAHGSDLGIVIALGGGRFREAIPTVIEDIAVGSRATAKRARRADPLTAINMAPELVAAAILLRQAYHHMNTGLPWKLADTAREPRRREGLAMALLPQERAVSAATAYRRGCSAMGETAVNGAVWFVVICEWSLAQYDAYREWREGSGKIELVKALERLAAVYGVV